MTGVKCLHSARWLLGFDFDGTLADVTNGHSVSGDFFATISRLKTITPYAWGICTGRSLEFLCEGMVHAQFPFYPDFVVTQERDIHYRVGNDVTLEYEPDTKRNKEAKRALQELLRENTATIDKVRHYVQNKTAGQWVSIPGDPAGLIASHESEVDEVVRVYNACKSKTEKLEYQRSTIYLRFSHQDYCKGSALQHIQSSFSITPDKTFVMGDNYNDLTMLNRNVAAHYGAPDNAVPVLKEKLLQEQGFITNASYTAGVVEALEALVSHKV